MPFWNHQITIQIDSFIWTVGWLYDEMESDRNAILYRSHMVVFTDDYIIWRPASENPADDAFFQEWPCMKTKDIFSDEASAITRSSRALLLREHCYNIT